MSKRAAYVAYTVAEIALLVTLIVVVPSHPPFWHYVGTPAVVLIAVIAERSRGWAVRKMSRPETPNENNSN
jgi:hypothetical protein